jgi:hypothetical protein
MYQEDAQRKAPKWAFLDEGSIPPGLDEDDPAVTAMATIAVDEHDRTYEIPSR